MDDSLNCRVNTKVIFININININIEGVQVFLFVKEAEMRTIEFGEKVDGLVIFLYTIKTTTAKAITATVVSTPAMM